MTLQDYILWLATNPSFEEMAIQSRSLTRKAIACCNRMLRAVRKAAKRISCLWSKRLRPVAGPVREPSTAKRQGVRTTYPPQSEMERYRADQMRANVESEIGQEETLQEAIEIIIESKNRRKA